MNTKRCVSKQDYKLQFLFELCFLTEWRLIHCSVECYIYYTVQPSVIFLNVNPPNNTPLYWILLFLIFDKKNLFFPFFKAFEQLTKQVWDEVCNYKALNCGNYYMV
jgi:hypothetical protein